MERDEIREQFWAAFDAFIPGTPDRVFEQQADLTALGLSAEQLDSGRVDPTVASRDDAPAIGG